MHADLPYVTSDTGGRVPLTDCLHVYVHVGIAQVSLATSAPAQDAICCLCCTTRILTDMLVNRLDGREGTSWSAKYCTALADLLKLNFVKWTRHSKPGTDPRQTSPNGGAGHSFLDIATARCNVKVAQPFISQHNCMQQNQKRHA